jgi:hypothetical protein
LTMGSPNPGAAAPHGTPPGQPVVTELGQVATLVVSESTSLPLLNVPENATHLRVTVACLSEGLTKWGFDSGGNNPGMGCSEDDIGEYGAWYDFALTASAALYVDVSPGGCPEPSKLSPQSRGPTPNVDPSWRESSTNAPGSVSQSAMFHRTARCPAFMPWVLDGVRHSHVGPHPPGPGLRN